MDSLSFRIRGGAQILCALLIMTIGVAMTHASTPIMSLDDIENGMEGEWKTVVDAEGVKTFRLKVVGVARNFIGPRMDIIICEALDEDQILNGPVSGMSGSPVYIDGKLVGAYAYGFPFSKEQTLIGVQPIEHMLETLDYPDTLVGSQGKVDTSSARADWRMVKGIQSTTMDDFEKVLSPLPVTLVASGVSAETLAVFQDEAKALGVQLQQGAGGGSSDMAYALEPGMPVAAVLMSGDFGIAGTGTVTWREGDRILGFGHPFMKWGAVDIPMAGADILTVVRRITSSYKLSTPGKVVGAIYQDRQTAIAGEIGRKAFTTHLNIEVDAPISGKRMYSAKVIKDERFTPLMLAMGILEATQSTMAAEREQSLLLDMKFTVRDYGSFNWTLASGRYPISAIIELHGMLETLMNNPFELPFIESLEVTIRQQEGWHDYRLRSAELLRSAPCRAGDTLKVRYAMEQARGEVIEKVASYTLPESLPAGDYQLSLVDAATLNTWKQTWNMQLRRDFSTLEDYLDYMSQLPANNNIYLVLSRKADGLFISGDALMDLPASARSIFTGGQGSQAIESTHIEVLNEQAIPMPGAFTGGYTFNITLLP